MPRLSEVYAHRITRWQQKKTAALLAMASAIEQAQREVLNEPYPPASRPGSPPHRRSGRLQAESGTKINVQTGSIQLINAAPYASFLRDGTSRMARRPWQAAALARARTTLDDIEKRMLRFGDD
jgi:hypothetical protein